VTGKKFKPQVTRIPVLLKPLGCVHPEQNQAGFGSKKKNSAARMKSMRQAGTAQNQLNPVLDRLAPGHTKFKASAKMSAPCCK
jgi:hypothetical protein